MIKIMKFGEVSPDEVFARVEPTVNVEDIVTDIIANVRTRGDAALYEYTEKFDRVTLSSLAVTREEIDEAVAAVEPEFLEILKKAAKNIRAFHEKQQRNWHRHRSEGHSRRPCGTLCPRWHSGISLHRADGFHSRQDRGMP